jgi:hypothetical protein
MAPDPLHPANLLGDLEQVQLLDCTGHASHVLRLLADGTVSITFAAGHVALVDPASRRCLTPGMRLDPSLLDAACALRPRG